MSPLLEQFEAARTNWHAPQRGHAAWRQGRPRAQALANKEIVATGSELQPRPVDLVPPDGRAVWDATVGAGAQDTVPLTGDQLPPATRSALVLPEFFHQVQARGPRAGARRWRRAQAPGTPARWP
jgi:hypothetical protein